MKICKYEFSEFFEGIKVLEMHHVYKFLKLDTKSGMFCVWAIVDETTEQDSEKWHLKIFVTGYSIPDGYAGIYLNTVSIGSNVWHIFLDHVETTGEGFARKLDKVLSDLQR